MISAIIALIDQNFTQSTGKKPTLRGSSNHGEKALKNLRIEKLFEIVALSELLVNLKKANSTLKFALCNGGLSGKKLVLQSAPGLADLTKSHIRVAITGQPHFATIWTNVEFFGHSHQVTGINLPGSYHEADVVMLDTNAHGGGVAPVRPPADSVMLMIECKYLDILPKAVLRTMLGLRRELSLLSNQQPTSLAPFLNGAAGAAAAGLANALPVNPGSHVIFCYPNHYGFYPISDWQAPGKVYGIEFWPL
ncbi:hypothetical protein SAMN03097694_2401 [Janthinobacterium lividum]|uniref:Uncharacterized protein n=1 Tax=Janthinobacterium lividum TaxID=29581 RepID=A0AB38C7I3_9BURK|nr:hypothetical protein [Janthinobacterium lividum]SFX48044.1 hypothetical protein SAMN03097694_2401 [Janthinobacterium lividum]